MNAQANSKLDPKHYLDSNDSYHFWDTVGGLVKTGHTGTNVMDIQMLTFRKQRKIYYIFWGIRFSIFW